MALHFINLIAFPANTDPEIQTENYTVKLHAESAIAIPKLAIIKRNVFSERIIAKPEAYLPIDDEFYDFSDIDSIHNHSQGDSLVFTF
jgi:hypothetical protein